MESQTAFTVAAVANALVDDQTKHTLDRVAFSGLTQPQGSTSHELSKQWVNLQAYTAVYNQLAGPSRADILRAHVIDRVAKHMKQNPRMTEKEKEDYLKNEIAQFVAALNA
eukprot:m.15821 g.15821  ORF g.15821 m.15821 type:complete len:111 (+) comp4528_c0_seq1:83-415(+)